MSQDNVYPNVDNYPSPTFPSEVPSPDVDPDEGTLILVAYNPAWTPVLMVALQSLLLPSTWEGTHDQKITALNQAANLQLLLQEDISTVPAPYWDDDTADDADDTAPVDIQPWYGLLIDDNLSFVENIGFWVITAFVAVAATPAAAIAFIPIARRFTLAFKKHDLGGIVRAFIDGAEVGQMDTYAPSDSVGEMTIIIPETMSLLEDSNVLWVSMSDEVNPAVDGEPNIQVIRKRLDEAQVSPPPNVRYNPECQCVETSPDDGETWTETPEADPRHGDMYRRPPIDTADPQCDAAHHQRLSVKKWIDDSIHGASNVVNVTAGFGAAVAVFAFLTGGATLLIDLIVEVIDVLVSIGIEVIDEAMTDEVYDQFECILYCSIAADGTVSEAQLAQIRDRLNDDIGGIPAVVIGSVLDLFGEVGLSNAATFAIGEDGDCDDCDCTVRWEYLWDFRDGERDFIPNSAATGGYGSACALSAGNGWGVDPTHPSNAYGLIYAIDIQTAASFSVPSTSHLTGVEITFSHASNSPGCHIELWIAATRPTTVPAFQIYQAEYTTSVVWSGDITNQSGLLLDVANWWINAGFYLESIKASGTDDIPDFVGGEVV